MKRAEINIPSNCGCWEFVRFLHRTRFPLFLFIFFSLCLSAFQSFFFLLVSLFLSPSLVSFLSLSFFPPLHLLPPLSPLPPLLLPSVTQVSKSGDSERRTDLGHIMALWHTQPEVGVRSTRRHAALRPEWPMTQDLVHCVLRVPCWDHTSFLVQLSCS